MDRTYQPHEFASRARVTIRALHHYDRLGLLKPSGRTSAGYRLYTDRDFVRLSQIVALKFIGFPLTQIREFLNRKDVDIADALEQQRRIIAAKRDHLDRAIRAIERAEAAVANHPTDCEPFRKIIEVIQMHTKKDWMKTYFTEQQLIAIRKRWTPELQAESDRICAALQQETEAAIARGIKPDSETGLRLAAQRRELLHMFTGGDPGIEETFRKIEADEANWPSTFKRPFTDEVNHFLNEAAKELDKTPVS